MAVSWFHLGLNLQCDNMKIPLFCYYFLVLFVLYYFLSSATAQPTNAIVSVEQFKDFLFDNFGGDDIVGRGARALADIALDGNDILKVICAIFKE